MYANLVTIHVTSPTAEDDGYLVGYTHDEAANISYMLMFNATDLSLQAQIKMPQRVPWGFHGLWMWNSQLEAARAREFIADEK